MAIKSVKEIKNLNGKKFLVRCDFDVPLDSNGQVADATRIEACIPTIKYLLENKALVAMLTKIGRPKDDKRTSTRVLLPTLEKLLKYKISWVPNLNYRANLDNLVLLENARFYPEEEKQDEAFAKKLAKPYDYYINEAFAMCHRKDASVSLIPKFLPSYAGFRLIKELEILTKLLKNPQRPFIAIIGGAKAETKIPVIENLAKLADKVLVGGKISLELGSSLLKLPRLLNSKDWKEGKDIGPNTIKLFTREISKAKTIVWNGPMGIFETPPYDFGTNQIAKAVSESSAYKVIGGGDTISAVSKIGLLDKVDFVSTGGGAMLALLSGRSLPGVGALT